MDRRAVLALPVAAGASVALAATHAAPKASGGPDAALLALCDEFQRLNTRLWNLHLEGLSDDDMERVGDEVSAELSEVSAALMALPPAATAAGMWARVAAVIAWRPVLLDDAAGSERCEDERLVGMLLRELAAALGQNRVGTDRCSPGPKWWIIEA
ncbi:hypothetical protein EOD42_07550 [Rhodovarius crocodyli]|uniref:Twin-arginine translocation pathway signal protein n=1 Tax=Rhodovarius crocodyli TaxID=1979269 RepID=A0A437MJ63_9PROT|nr:hypothetical protein [Rhodovarius crocodyli]RVT97663.1 hypothetical protein EOD42_07550 [Rhodovarius crocodyli]